MSTAKTELIVCETCNFSQDKDQPHGGTLLFNAIEQSLSLHPIEGLSISRTKCMMSCSRSCNVHLRSQGKISYVIGDLKAEKAYLEMLHDYIKLYQISDTGQVAYKQWPELIKGKFVARLPPVITEA